MESQFRRVKKYLDIIKNSVFYNCVKLENISYKNCEYKENNSFPPLSEFIPYEPESFWGSGADSHAWFHIDLKIPEEMRSFPLRLVVKTERKGWDADNPQFICYIDGKMRQGLDINHTFVFLGDKESYDVYLYGYTGPKIRRALLYAELVNVHENAEQLYYDILVPFEILSYLDQNSKEYAEILYHLDTAVGMLDLFDVGNDDYFASIDQAKAYMDSAFYGEYCSTQPATTVCIGHTHIDCAWKWTLKQTREKVQRSFATVLELMKYYPEYKFMSSQALLYQNLKEEAPELYEEVKEMIKAGRWECEGAMWVEADCNLTSGESLVRQLLYGKKYMREAFGKESRVCFLPDVFGYSAAMPQILKKSGVDHFITSKISWNDTNTMPMDAFLWQGIDGSEILSSFITTWSFVKNGPQNRQTTYVGKNIPTYIRGAWERFAQKEYANVALNTYGHVTEQKKSKSANRMQAFIQSVSA
jgi:alpha-mannosidase